MSSLCRFMRSNIPLVTIIIIMFNAVYCYPLGKPDLNGDLNKDEKRYPNGTIVGKYSYKDKEGNPIQVKYYADDASYGVELKSLKVVSSSDSPLVQAFKQTNENNLFPNTDTTLGVGADFYNPTNIKYKTTDPFEILKKDSKNNPFKLDKTDSDYEIYFQNELKAPKKCGKDRVKVYFDKEKRKIREASNTLEETARFCSQF